jgi:uncharacterized protein YbbC (DUF1343 family)
MKYSRLTRILLAAKYTILASVLVACHTNNKTKTSEKRLTETTQTIRDAQLLSQMVENQPQPAAYDVDSWIEKVRGKNVALIGNQTSVVPAGLTVVNDRWDQPRQIKYRHLVDTLLDHGVELKKVFAPEHGFRGTADAGATIEDGVDSKTGLPIISLYGSNKKPTVEQLAGIDLVIFDIQDVGARFYTYISTLHYVMEACAENDISVLILDRPNPNGHYIDGPILEPQHKSFVGMHPVPIVHGMTIGEYAKMINGEKWLENSVQCQLEVVKCKNYTHETPYSLPINPSPNLPNDQAINLYPSLCFFEGTKVSVGRGTDMQFQVYGSPSLVKYIGFSFTPTPNPGAKRPKFNGKRCFGRDLREHPRLDKIELEFLVDAFAKAPYKEKFFNSFFTKLAGTEKLQKQIERGMSADEIAATWQGGLAEYQKIGEKYLIYD